MEYEARINEEAERRIAAEEALRSEYTGQFEAMQQEMDERFKATEKRITETQTEITAMKEILDTKASKADLLILESRVDECAPTSRVDILEEDIATRAPREYVQAVETAMKKKADRTDLQVHRQGRSTLLGMDGTTFLAVTSAYPFVVSLNQRNSFSLRTLEPSNSRTDLSLSWPLLLLLLFSTSSSL